MTKLTLKEYEKKTKRKTTYEISKILLNDLSLIEKGKGFRKERLRELLRLRKGEKSKLTQETLLEAYWIKSRELTRLNLRDYDRTGLERKLEYYLREFTRIKFHHSLWVGNQQFDFLLPQYGIFIEVNGFVHYNPVKMKKDALKLEIITNELGCVLMVLRNEDVGLMSSKIIQFIKEEPRISSRRVKNIWRRIAVETLAATADLSWLSTRFAYDFNMLAREVYGYRARG